MLQDGVDGSNGIFLYGASGGFPTNSFNSSNYWVDVVFSTAGGGSSGPVVTSTSPGAGAAGIPVTTAITATFNKALDPATVSSSTFRLLDSSNALVPASVSYDPATFRAMLTPNASLGFATTYTAILTGRTNGIKDSSGNGMAGDVSWNFTTTAGANGVSVWTAATTPSTIDSGDPNAVEVGVRFRSDVAGSILGIRFYKNVANTGVHAGHLWSNGGSLLASATFTDESASGWQQVTFPSPVSIAAGTTYIASYFAPNGHYSLNSGYFAAAGADNAPLHLLKDGVDGVNGAFVYGPAGAFPVNTFNSSNYWVDIVFSTGVSGSSGPSVTTESPAQGALDVAVTSTVTATFDRALNATTVNTTTFRLLDASNAAVPSSVTYNAATLTATSAPSSSLNFSSAYHAVISGGVNGIKDTSGNPMASDLSWNFSTRSAQSTISIWAPATTPTVVDSSDPAAVELGVRFRSDVAGSILGIRFYKSTANAGIHVGNLWSNTGTLLGSATFSGESASGWQQVTFAAPIAIAANTTYVASYFAPNGHYSLTGRFLRFPGADNAPLHLLKDGVDGGNGAFVYGAASGFPVNTFNAGNYWVDVVFTDRTLPPSITTQPASTTITSGQTATLMVAATGSALTYQWYVGTSGDTSQPVTGATAPSYSTPVLTANRSYWVSVSNSAGTANSNTATITVNPAPSSTTLTASPNPSVADQAVTLTATVTAGATGTITFLDSATSLGAATVNNGRATLSTSQLSVGSHNLTAAYSGDAGFTASTSIVVPLAVNLITTSTTLSASPNPSVTGQTVTLTATVAPVSPSVGTPSGSIIFKDGATTLGSVALANGTATLSTSSLALGPHSVAASYGGGGNFAASASTAVGQTVNPISTTTTLTTSLNPSRFGQSVTFTVTVGPVAPGTGTPAGSVTFQDGSNPIGTANLSAGAATLATSSLPAGSHSISAVYAGAGNFAGSTSSAVTQTVNKASTTNVFTSNLNPSVYGQSVTLKAVLSAVAPGAGTPTGAVTFKDGSATVGTANLSGGTAITSISTLIGGSHSLTAVYNGDSNFDVSTSPIVTQTVNKASTATSLDVTPASSVFGQPVTLKATISSSSVNMTGIVTFKDGATTIGTASVSGGVASLSVSNLSPTFHLLSATYAGDTNYSGSTSSTVINLVNQASTTSRVSSSASPSVFGQSVTLAATVSPVAPSIAYSYGKRDLPRWTLHAGHGESLRWSREFHDFLPFRWKSLHHGGL